jgi:hypothetical protein
MMTDEELLEAIGKRAAIAETRTDYAKTRPRKVAPPATQELIGNTERELGFLLYPFHRRLLEAVGNGGFGPGDGLIGTAGGSLDVEGRSLSELRRALWPDSHLKVVPLCDWGDGIWACIDVVTGAVLTMSEFGLMDIGQSFRCWFERWIDGANLWHQMVILEDTRIQNPRTREWITVAGVKGMKGRPYVQGKQ